MPNLPYSSIPLCSSHQVTTALERLGAYVGKRGRGSHAPYHKDAGDGRILTAVVVLDKKEMPKGTLRSILTSLEIPIEDFRDRVP